MQPTLHEYGIYAMKLRLKDNQDIISYPSNPEAKIIIKS